MVGLTSGITLVFEAARNLGADDAEVTSWVWALCLGMAVLIIVPSLRYRAPVMIAFSAPGAAILATLPKGSFTLPQAIGAFMVGGLLAAVVGFLAFAPEDITSRLSSIKEADEDSSFMGRVIAWKISSAIALANPVFGGGFHAVQVQTIWDTFKTAPSLLGFLNLPVPEFSAKAAHRIYFEVMGDLGFVGLGLFLFMMLRAIWSRFTIKRMAAQLGPSFQWARDMGDMLMLSVLAYMVGGASVSVGYLEVIYMVVMLMELLRLHVARAAANVPKEAA